MEIRERLKNEQKKLEEIVCRGLEYAKKSVGLYKARQDNTMFTS